MDATDKERIITLTTKLVAGMIANGKLDPNDDEALKKATKECAAIAKEAYFAALDFLK